MESRQQRFVFQDEPARSSWMHARPSYPLSYYYRVIRSQRAEHAWAGPVQTGSQLHNSAVSVPINHLNSPNVCGGVALLLDNEWIIQHLCEQCLNRVKHKGLTLNAARSRSRSGSQRRFSSCRGLVPALQLPHQQLHFYENHITSKPKKTTCRQMNGRRENCSAVHSPSLCLSEMSDCKNNLN